MTTTPPAAAPSSGSPPANTCSQAPTGPAEKDVAAGVLGGPGIVGAVALAKICGIETEYGIVLRGAGESNPIAASSVLINAYVNELARVGDEEHPQPKIGWDFEDESPGNDARGSAPEGTMA